METGAGKRRRNESETTTKEEVGETRDVTDDEVNEFFAIIRRMREARRRLAGSIGARSREERVRTKKNDDDDDDEEIWRWRPVFVLEDFKRPQAEPKPAQLDLNTKPEADDAGDHTGSVSSSEKQ
ncbi:protein NEGATIVE REGULATOR OF RESISTANCE-like [Dioscorea cayenensis subsp. rotundata]|uniref:Protein NEGATIVE REGULATOR OF RESISTANCE-like n=1 Tax=Dioscorea cayennensis subsp. rotundata TaxID=55577 RepID=A0AB40CUP8_DIOCR|nr:protein NEGATIVE REGULATOR OF RESISTANCE-like [Dioscorea cayenensis subsp. rotundata]